MTTNSPQKLGRTDSKLFRNLIEDADRALDLAGELADDHEDALDQIESVREFVHRWLDGRRAELLVSDLLTTLGLLFAALELDLGIDSVALLAPLRAMPANSVLRCRGIGRESQPTIVIRLPARSLARSAA